MCARENSLAVSGIMSMISNDLETRNGAMWKRLYRNRKDIFVRYKYVGISHILQCTVPRPVLAVGMCQLFE